MNVIRPTRIRVTGDDLEEMVDETVRVLRAADLRYDRTHVRRVLQQRLREERRLGDQVKPSLFERLIRRFRSDIRV